ncbi:MAG: FAD-dependent oxidoreductase, partial [Clostridia bacterium]|nr:FAD-dependent oxidoreductase [Clostridia bacterium]
MKKLVSLMLALLMLTGVCASAETFTGAAQGNGGEVSVTLTVEDGKITDAVVVGEMETKGIAYEQCADGTFAGLILEAQGAEFDAIAGATVTSNAVKAATVKAMEAAGLAEAEAVVVEDVTVDLVIVGAGGAGMSAALQAVDSGVESVIVVEKGGSTGGNTSRATGGMNAAKTAAQDKNEWKDATTTAV